MSGDELVLTDCPMTAFRKIAGVGVRNIAGRSISGITILVTHTHGDHAGGIGTLIHYSYYVLHIPVTVIAPSEDVASDLFFLADRLEGCSPKGYTIMTAAQADKVWLTGAVPTRHSPELTGRCFGYRLNIDGRNVIYTGDTAEIDPFLPYIADGTVVYSDVSLNGSHVHISFDELCAKLSGLKIELYLMHIDDPVKLADLIKDTEIKIAPLFDA